LQHLSKSKEKTKKRTDPIEVNPKSDIKLYPNLVISQMHKSNYFQIEETLHRYNSFSTVDKQQKNDDPKKQRCYY